MTAAAESGGGTATGPREPSAEQRTGRRWLPSREGVARRARSWVQHLAVVMAWCRERAATLVLFGVVGAITLHHARSFLPFMADDAFISLRYAQRLAEGHGLTWSDGNRVEGYSNLLWVLLVAAPATLGVDPVLVARALGVASTGLCLAACVARPFGARHGALPAIALALSGPIAVWAIGGLEAPLFAALLAFGALRAGAVLEAEEPGRRDALVLGGVLGALVLTRPEGAVLALGTLGAALLLAGTRPRREVLALALLVVLGVTLAQLGFRRLYHGDWLPNTAYAKVAFNAQRAREGWRYLRGGLLHLWPVWALGAAGAVVALTARAYRRRVLLVAVPLLGWMLGVVAMGGDIMPARRHLVPGLVLAALLGGMGLATLEAGWRRRVFVGLACLSLGPLMVLQLRDPENRRARRETWEWDAVPVGALLARHFGSAAPLLAVDAAGALPYFARLPALDMLGLNDRELARRRPPDFGTGPLAHELGSGELVLARRPDLVSFGLPLGSERARFRGGRELERLPAFRSEYRALYFEAREPWFAAFVLYARVTSERLGFRVTENSLHLPGYLMARSPATPAVETSEGALVAVAGRETPLSVELDPPGAGDYRLCVTTVGPAASLVVKVQGAPRARGVGQLDLAVVSGERLEVHVAPLAARRTGVLALDLVRVALERAAAPGTGCR